MLALVMPLSLLAGDSWQQSRELLAKNYTDLIIVSIAAERDEDMSFSADTDMGECLVVGRRTPTKSARATFVVLDERPSSTLLGSAVARQIRTLRAGGQLRTLEDGPFGGSPLTFGDTVVGAVLDAPLSMSGVWNPNRISDLSLAQTAYQLVVHDRLWLPSTKEPDKHPIPIVQLHHIATIGPYHSDVVGKTPKGGIRGPFDKLPIKGKGAPTYPILWSHNAEKERTLLFDADCEGRPKVGKTAVEKELITEKVHAIAATASHAHFNQNFRFNSQSTAMQYTPYKAIGGRAWLSIALPTPDHEKALVLWGNSSLGLLLHWYYSNKQQSGRGNIGKEALQRLPILNVTALTAEQLKSAASVFDDLAKKPLAIVSDIDTDATRSELDRRFLGEVLGLAPTLLQTGGPFDLLRRKLAAEPSISGGKADDVLDGEDED
jgi:hypothetical protein